MVCTLENGGAFVHFVEHGDIEHVRARLFVGHDLRPQELPFQPGNRAEFGALQVVPTEARKHDGHVVDVMLTRPDNVLFPVFLCVALDARQVAKPPDTPRAQYVSREQYTMKLRILQRIPVLHAPSRCNPQHHAASVCFEFFDQCFARLKTRTPLDLIVKTDAPNGYERHALMMLIGGVFCDVHLASQYAPVIEHLDETPVRHAGQVIHDRVGTAVAVGPFTCAG